MGDFDDAFIQALKTQSWSLYGVGMAIIALRLFARAKRLGIRNLQLDDYLMILVAGLYTALVLCLNVISQGGGSNLYPPEMEGTFTEEEIRERIYGSKIVVVSEQSMLNVIYVLKACMLTMYTRLTLGLTTQRMVRYLAWYVVAGWVATEIAFFTACRPFQGYWAMPPPDPQCTTLEHYAIVQGCFNLSSDALMLFIPLPLLLRLSMPWKQKIVLVLIFSMGMFVIVAALLTKIFNLTNIWDPSYMLWYVREASVAVYVSNLPMIWPLLREGLPFLKYLTPGHVTTSQTGSKGRMPGYGNRTGTGKGGSWAKLSQPSRLPLNSESRDATRTEILSPNSTRKAPSGTASQISIDTTYDVEMTIMDHAVRHHKGDDSSSTEQIILGHVDPGDTDTGKVLGGIQVERTIEVREEVGTPTWYGGTDVEKSGFDWSVVRSRYHADASRGG